MSDEVINGYDGKPAWRWVEVRPGEWAPEVVASGATVEAPPADALRVLSVDINGNPVGASIGTTLGDVIAFDTAPASTVRAVDVELLIAAGKFSDAFEVNKFGRNPVVDTGTVPEDVWGGGGLYTGFPTTGTAEQVRVVSTSANDTAAGTGARSVYVEGLDADYNRISEVIPTNGLGNGISIQEFWRLHRAYVVEAGSATTNVGSITVSHVLTTANIFAVILAGFGQAKTAAYTVPAGYTANVRRYGGSILGTNTTTRAAEIALMIREFGKAQRLRYPFAVANTAFVDSLIPGGIQLPEKTDIMMRVTNVSATVDVTSFFDLFVLAD